MNPSPHERAGQRLLRVAFLFYLLLAVAGALALGWLRGGPIPLAAFLRPTELALDLGLGLAAAALLALAWELARRHLAPAAELEARLGELVSGLRAEEAVALALLSGIAEETFFRGALQEGLGWIAATLLFALLHSGPSPALRLWGLFALAAGALFAGLVVWRATLAPAMVAHVTVNVLNLLRLSRQGRHRTGA